jgi:3-oxoacyl-[acyl-carrier-protein] synthase-3
MPPLPHVYAEIVGWGHCLPPAILTNHDLATFLNTSDAWIEKRTGIKQRCISHVPVSDLATVAAARALACAGIDALEIELIILGTCTGDEQMPNTASRVQRLLGARNAGALDVNTACTSFMYALSIGSSLIRTGAVRNAVVIGADTLSMYMDWENRAPSILFGDGAGAVVLAATDEPVGIVAEVLGCNTEDRDMLRIRGLGTAYSNVGVTLGTTRWDFNGPEIFRQAVRGMADASHLVLAKAQTAPSAIDLVIPHQANLRIIESVAKRLSLPNARVFTNVERYGNLSSASIPVAIAEAIEREQLGPNGLILIPAFGGGLTWSAHIVRWGSRVVSRGYASASLAPSPRSGLEIVMDLRREKDRTRQGTLP